MSLTAALATAAFAATQAFIGVPFTVRAARHLIDLAGPARPRGRQRPNGG